MAGVSLNTLVQYSVELGKLHASELHVGDPLTCVERPKLAPAATELTVSTVEAEGHIACAWARAPFKKKTTHEYLAHVAVDGGWCCFASRDPDTLTEAQRTQLSKAQSLALPITDWCYGFQSGWGDGSYAVFVEKAGADVVGLWIDFGVVEINEASDALQPKLSNKDLEDLLAGAEECVSFGIPVADLKALAATRKKSLVKRLIPRVVTLLEADPLPDQIAAVAQSWRVYPEFFEELAKRSLAAERWRDLVSRYGLLRHVPLPSCMELRFANDREIPEEIRFKFGDATALWSEAAERDDDASRLFFLRAGVHHAAPSAEAAATIEQRYAAKGDQEVVKNLRRSLEARLP